MPEFTNPSVVDLSVLRGVLGCFCFNLIKYDCMPIAVLTLLNVPHLLASVYEDTTLRIFLHYVWIGLFLLGVVFTRHVECQLLI